MKSADYFSRNPAALTDTDTQAYKQDQLHNVPNYRWQRQWTQVFWPVQCLTISTWVLYVVLYVIWLHHCIFRNHIEHKNSSNGFY